MVGLWKRLNQSIAVKYESNFIIIIKIYIFDSYLVCNYWLLKVKNLKVKNFKPLMLINLIVIPNLSQIYFCIPEIFKQTFKTVFGPWNLCDLGW